MDQQICLTVFNAAQPIINILMLDAMPLYLFRSFNIHHFRSVGNWHAAMRGALANRRSLPYSLNAWRKLKSSWKLCKHQVPTSATQITFRYVGPILFILRQSTANNFVPFWTLFVFLIAVFLTGGASRSDTWSLVLLGPLSIVACGMALLTLKREHLWQQKWLLIICASVIGVAAAHAIPLPPAIISMSNQSPNLSSVGIAGTWRAFSLTPTNAGSALFSLFVPLAILLLGIQLSREELYRFLPTLIALGAASGLLGLLQVTGERQSSLYLYRITNEGSAVGLFANRNHAALFLACMFPMLALYASGKVSASKQHENRKWVAAALTMVLIPLILVTGSRSGLLIGSLGILGAYEIHRKSVSRSPNGKKPNQKWAVLISSSILALLVLVTFYFSRAEAIERFFVDETLDSSRSEFWPVVVQLVQAHLPFGSGLGSFAEAFHVVEPNLMLNSTYLNQAHNDWIETALTFGFVGVLLLAIVSIAFIRHAVMIWRDKDTRN